MRADAITLKTTSVLNLHHGVRASVWRLMWLLLPLLPVLIGLAADAFSQVRGGTFVVCGMIALLPASWALMMEGWSGAFSCTAIVSLFAYLIYCNAAIIRGDELVALHVEDFPHIGLSMRDAAADVNLAGTIALSVGLLLGYRPMKAVSTMATLKRSKLHVPDRILRNSIISIIGAFVLVRLFIIWQSGASLISFLGAGRQAEAYNEMVGPFSFIVSLATVFQVTAVIGGALLLLRRSRVPFARSVAIMGIMVPILERLGTGGRGQVIGYSLALIGLAMTVPVPRVRSFFTKAMPFFAIGGVLLFAAMSVYRVSGLSETEEFKLEEGLIQLIEYDQFTALEQCMYLFPNRFDTLKGETILALPANPIPRAIWPGKPSGLGHILPKMLKDNVTLTISAGLIGEGWANFLLPGAIMLPFFVGLFAALWDRLRNVGARWADGYALWAAGVPGLFFIVRGSFMIGGTFIMYSVVGMVLLLIVSGRFAESDENDAGTSSPRRFGA